MVASTLMTKTLRQMTTSAAIGVLVLMDMTVNPSDKFFKRYD
jgi:hypothetical protein